MKTSIRIGTRSSQLALWQANYVADELHKKYPQIHIELVYHETKGDRILAKSLAEIGGKGLFTEELEAAMQTGAIDIAVHSLKDMPTELPEGLMLGAVTHRDWPGDAFVSRKYKTLSALPEGAVVGTSSLRRQAQLLRNRPDLTVKLLRGNVNTRLRKLDEGEYDAIILAQAGLQRLGFSDRITQALTIEEMLPAVGQGALAIECRSDDQEMLTMLRQLNDEETVYAVTGERSFLRQLNGGCQVPMGVYGVCHKGTLTLKAMIASLDGKRAYEGEISGPCDKADMLGRNLAKGLYEEGGRYIIDELIREGVLK